jgi:integrase
MSLVTGNAFGTHGEVAGLTLDDINWEAGKVLVRGKSAREERLPLLRDQLCPRPKTSAFFVSVRGTRLTDCTVRRWFVIVSHRIGLLAPTDHRGPRIHDLRHRFAYRALLHWYRQGADVEAHPPALTTYLGHGPVADTYWHITASPELLRLATERLERPKGNAGYWQERPCTGYAKSGQVLSHGSHALWAPFAAAGFGAKQFRRGGLADAGISR